jgi:hypothetical protein
MLEFCDDGDETFLFSIRDLRNDAVSISDYVASNGRMVREWWTRGAVEGSGIGLIWGIILAFV